MAPTNSMIQLVGPGGAGKSTAGAALATRLGFPFHDLDREFERRRADIDTFIDAHGYEAYARENVSVYLELATQLPGSVLALSSGFMVYSPSVHPAYAVLTDVIARSRTTAVLLPSLDLETCVAETVRRQLGRPFGRRDANREEAVIRTLRPVHGPASDQDRNNAPRVRSGGGHFDETRCGPLWGTSRGAA